MIRMHSPFLSIVTLQADVGRSSRTRIPNVEMRSCGSETQTNNTTTLILLLCYINIYIYVLLASGICVIVYVV